MTQNAPGDLVIGPLVSRPDIIDLSRLTLEQDRLKRPAMILHMQPVAHVFPIAVERQGLPFQEAQYKKRDQFLRVLMRAEVVARARDRNRHSECPKVRECQQIAACLGARIRRVGVQRGALGEFLF